VDTTPVRRTVLTFTGVKVDGQLLSPFNPAPLTAAAGGWTPGPVSGGTFTIKHIKDSPN
jgi:hypothetical protein